MITPYDDLTGTVELPHRWNVAGELLTFMLNGADSFKDVELYTRLLGAVKKGNELKMSQLTKGTDIRPYIERFIYAVSWAFAYYAEISHGRLSNYYQGIIQEDREKAAVT